MTNTICTIKRAANVEVAETERFTLLLFDYGETIGMKLYTGSDRQLIAVCEHDFVKHRTSYAFTAGEKVISNSNLSLSERYEPVESMRTIESFQLSDSNLPTVSEAGIKECLRLWRMRDTLTVSEDSFFFQLCSGKTEYVFSIIPESDNIYCGASYNIAFDMGLFGGRQYFRIRNYKDNTEKFCGFHADLSYEAKDIDIPIAECKPGTCSLTSKGLAWTVKRYTDDEIVLYGCGGDEYIVSRLP